jgi:hypothetical protein
MTIRALLPGDAAAFQAVRLRGLQECPAAFASSHEEEVDTPIEQVAQRLQPQADRAVLGWFQDGGLHGVVGVYRERLRKLAHKAVIWGVYVVPEARGAGVGRALLTHALHHAAVELGVRQVILGVNVENRPAIALYEALGFETFGTEREFLRVGDRFHDEYQMVRHLKREA